MVNATNSDGNSSDTTDQGGEMVRIYKMKALHQGWTDWRSKWKMDYLRFKITQAEVQPTNEYNYPHVGKTGVDAVHEKAAHRWSISW
jgi:hypothetical protein